MYEINQEVRDVVVNSITKEDVENIEFMQGPVGFYPMNELDDKENGDMIEIYAGLNGKANGTYSLIRLAIRTKGALAGTILVKKLVVTDLMFPTVGEYESHIINFYLNSMRVPEKKEDDKLFSILNESKEFKNSVLLGIKEFNQDEFKEFYKYKMPDNLEFLILL